MAETKTQTLEREYVIPLRREWMKVPEYKRARKSAVAIKEFIAKHMKVTHRDVEKVKLDVYLNNELWFRGSRNAPARIKVKAVKEGEFVRVTMVDVPQVTKFLMAKHAKRHKKNEKKAEEPKVHEKKEEKTEAEKIEEKKDEVEKEKAVEEANIKMAETSAKAEKHTVKDKGKSQSYHRMALQK